MGEVIAFSQYLADKIKKESEATECAKITTFYQVAEQFENPVDQRILGLIPVILQSYRADIGDQWYFCLSMDIRGVLDHVEGNLFFVRNIAIEFLSNMPYREQEEEVIYRLTWSNVDNVVRFRTGLAERPIDVLFEYFKGYDIRYGGLVIPLYRFLSELGNITPFYLDNYDMNTERLVLNLSFPLADYDLAIEVFPRPIKEDEEWFSTGPSH